MKPVKVGICGLGTVGGGTFNVLKRNAEEIARRAGRGIEVAQIAARRPNPKCETGATPITADIFDVANNPEIDVVIELIGGYTLAHELVLKAIENGKHVVTANKALLAVHGNEIFAKAREKGVIVAFEAAVAGGIPVIKAIREGLAARAVHDAVKDAVLTTWGATALHEDVKVHDLEQYLPCRRRARGTMSTAYVAPFAQYAISYAETCNASTADDECWDYYQHSSTSADWKLIHHIEAKAA